MRKWEDYVAVSNIPSELTKELPIVAIYGGYQIGKSTLLNCLLGQYMALAGKGLATTALASRYRYGKENIIQYRTRPDSIYGGDLQETSLSQIRNKDFIEKNIDTESGFHIETRTPAELLNYCDIVDTPGYNASEQDNSIALNAMQHIHYVLFVVQNCGLSQPEKELLLKFRDSGISVSILMNCCQGRREERWIPKHKINRKYVSECESWISSSGIDVIPIAGQKVYLCNFLFYWSQMKDFSLSLQDIDRPDTIIKHINGTLKDEGYPTDRETILKLSCVPALIHEIKQKVMEYNPFTHEIGESIHEQILQL